MVRCVQCMLALILFLAAISPREAFGKGLSYAASPPSAGAAEVVLVSRRPRMARVPNYGIYYAPDLRYRLFLADQNWYLYHDDKWYQSRTHEGPWRYVAFSKVPEVLKKLPAAFTQGETPPPAKKKPVHKEPPHKKAKRRR